MHLVGRAIDLLALLQFLDDVWIPGGCQESRKPVQTGDDTVLDFARRHLTRPADHAGHAEATLEYGAFALREGCLSAIGPGEDFGAVIGGEDHDGIVVDAHVLELL